MNYFLISLIVPGEEGPRKFETNLIDDTHKKTRMKAEDSSCQIFRKNMPEKILWNVKLLWSNCFNSSMSVQWVFKIKVWLFPAIHSRVLLVHPKGSSAEEGKRHAHLSPWRHSNYFWKSVFSFSTLLPSQNTFLLD